jgi:hypothetical protein
MENQPTDPLDFEMLDDSSLEEYVRCFCREVTDIDIEELKPLRNAIEEVLTRWNAHKQFNKSFEEL